MFTDDGKDLRVGDAIPRGNGELQYERGGNSPKHQPRDNRGAAALEDLVRKQSGLTSVSVRRPVESAITPPDPVKTKRHKKIRKSL